MITLLTVKNLLLLITDRDTDTAIARLLRSETLIQAEGVYLGSSHRHRHSLLHILLYRLLMADNILLVFRVLLGGANVVIFELFDYLLLTVETTDLGKL